MKRMTQSQLCYSLRHKLNNGDCVQWTCDLAAIEMILKTGSRSVTNHSELLFLKRLWCIETQIKYQCYQFGIEWDQFGKFVQSVITQWLTLLVQPEPRRFETEILKRSYMLQDSTWTAKQKRCSAIPLLSRIQPYGNQLSRAPKKHAANGLHSSVVTYSEWLQHVGNLFACLYYFAITYKPSNGVYGQILWTRNERLSNFTSCQKHT